MILPQDLATLAAQYGFVYKEGSDDLGCYQVAALELTRGEQAWIFKHETDANPGTLVYVDARADVAEAQTLLLVILGLTREDFAWAAACRSVSIAPGATIESAVH